MPLTIGSLVGGAFFAAGASVAAVNSVIGITAGLVSAAGTIALSVGASALAGALFKPKVPGVTAATTSAALNAPRPEDIQQSFRQATAPRQRHYGRVKTSGPWAFAESGQGNFYKVIALGQGKLVNLHEVWIDDNVVTISGDGYVSSAPYLSAARVLIRNGLPTETSYSELTAVFPEYTTAHRGDGVASLFLTLLAVPDSKFLGTFPNGINTNGRVVADFTEVKNPLTGTIAWDDAAASLILDYMQHADGMRLPADVFTTPLADAGWKSAYNRCVENVALNAGGYESRYRLWGSYRFDERPADVLGRMLACCDGRIVPTSDGGLTLKIGDWAEPTVVLDETVITGISELRRGHDVLSTANVIRATYTDPNQDFQTADADPWIDVADVSKRGEISADASFIMSPSHSQTRRLMKKAAYRANPKWIGAFQCNLKALEALGERLVRVTYPPFSIDEVFEVDDFDIIIEQGDIVSGVTLQLISLPQESEAWDETQEEGDAPVTTSTTADTSIPDPTDFSAVMADTVIGGSTVPYAILSFDAPPSPALKTEARGKKTTDTAWSDISVAEAATSADSFALATGERYEFQIRHVTIGLREGDWTPSIEIDALTTAGAPAAATGVSAAGGAGQATINFTSPADANYACQNIYRSATNDFGTATLELRVFGEQSTAESWMETGLATGTYYYWLKSRNTIGTESASVATGAVVVT